MSSDVGGSMGSAFPAVLGAARGGDGRAFERLYLLFHRRVYAFARVRGSSDPEGLVNEVFLGVFTNISTFEGNQAQFTAWVFRIARNKLIDEARHRGRRPIEVAMDEAMVEGLVSVDDIESAALSRVGSASLLAYLDVLTEEQRDVVLLRVVADLTIESVAEIVGRRPGAVKALQHRAFLSLARKMSAEGRTPSGRSNVPGH